MWPIPEDAIHAKVSPKTVKIHNPADAWDHQIWKLLHETLELQELVLIGLTISALNSIT